MKLDKLIESFISRIIKYSIEALSFGSALIGYVTYFNGDSPKDKHKTLLMIFRIFDSHAFTMSLLCGGFLYYILKSISFCMNNEKVKAIAEMKGYINAGKLDIENQIIEFRNQIVFEINNGIIEINTSASEKFNFLNESNINKINNLNTATEILVKRVDNLVETNEKFIFPLNSSLVMIVREIVIPKLFTKDEFSESIKLYPYFNINGLKLFGLDENELQIIIIENYKRQLDNYKYELEIEIEKKDSIK